MSVPPTVLADLKRTAAILKTMQWPHPRGMLTLKMDHFDVILNQPLDVPGAGECTIYAESRRHGYDVYANVACPTLKREESTMHALFARCAMLAWPDLSFAD